jgi:hypothetical protein
MLLDVISFALSVLILCLLPPLPAAKETKHIAETSGYEGKALAPGVPTSSVLGVLRASGLLRLLFAIGFLLTLIIGNFDLLAPVFIRDILRQSSNFFSLLISIVGIGMVASSGWLMWRKSKTDPWLDIIIGSLLLALIPTAIWLSSLTTPTLGVVLMIIGCLLGGLGNSLLIVQVGTLLQILSPRHVLGRLSGLFQSTLSAAQLFTLLVTPLLVPVHISIGPFVGLGAVALLLLTGSTILTLYRTHLNSVQPEASKLSDLQLHGEEQQIK